MCEHGTVLTPKYGEFDGVRLKSRAEDLRPSAARVLESTTVLTFIEIPVVPVYYPLTPIFCRGKVRVRTPTVGTLSHAAEGRPSSAWVGSLPYPYVYQRCSKIFLSPVCLDSFSNTTIHI